MSEIAVISARSAPVDAGRHYHLDGLRGLAALVVVFHHFVLASDFALYTGRAEDSRGAWDLWLASLPLETGLPGNLAVCLFFALSGYVLAGSFSRTSLGVTALIVRRYIRLGLPIFVVVMTAWALYATGAIQNQAVAPLTHSSWLSMNMPGQLTIWQALGDGVYGSLILGYTSFDSSLWTMSIELVGSLLLIFIFVGTRMCCRPETLNRWRGLLLFLAVVATYNSYLFLFSIGAAMAVFDLRRHYRRWCTNPWMTACTIAVGLVFGMVSESHARPYFVSWIMIHTPISRISLPFPATFGMTSGEPFWHAWGAVLLLAAIDGSPRLRQIFSARYFKFLGQISFPLYLIHVPILLSVGCGLYSLLIGHDVPVALATAIAFIAYVCVAIAAGMALNPVETFAVRLSGYVGLATQAIEVRMRQMLTRRPG